MGLLQNVTSKLVGDFISRIGHEILERAARIELASSAWKAEVLPLHNARIFHLIVGGGGGWIRTNVLIRDQIYSLTPLTTRPLLLISTIQLKKQLSPTKNTL